MIRNTAFFYYPILVTKGEKFIRSMKKTFKGKLPDNIVIKSTCLAVRLKYKFNIKTRSKKKHQHYILR